MSLDIYIDVSYHLKSQARVCDLKGRKPEMRKSKQEAAETRRRIVKAAAAKFRQNGIGGTGLSDLMAAAGLTHGGFLQALRLKGSDRRGGLCRRYGIREGDIFLEQIPQERIEGAGCTIPISGS